MYPTKVFLLKKKDIFFNIMWLGCLGFLITKLKTYIVVRSKAICQYIYQKK